MKSIVMVWYFLFALLISGLNHAYADENKGVGVNEVQGRFEKSWHYLTRMHLDKSALGKAVVLLEKGIAIAPDNCEVYWRLAEITFKTADEEKDGVKRKRLYEKTIEYADKALEINPQSLEGQYWKGCSSARLAEMAGIFSAIGLVKGAKEALSKTIEIDSNHRYSVLSKAVLAAIYTVPPWPLKDLEKAEKYALEAVEQDPNLTIASQNLAMFYIASKQMKKARTELERGLAIKNPTYIWDSELYDWPKMRALLKDMEN